MSGQTAGATPTLSGGRTITLTLHSSRTIAAGETVTLTVGAGAVRDVAGNHSTLVVTGITVINAVPVSPAVSSVALTSAPGADNTYAIGDSVTATVTFDAAVDITGSPQLELLEGSY